MNRKELKLIFNDIIDFYKNVIKQIQNDSTLEKNNQKQMLEYATKILKSRVFEKAYKIFSTNDRKIIDDYLNYEFQDLPTYIQKLIFYKTSSLTLDGKSIYNNFFVSPANIYSLCEEKDSVFDPLSSYATTEISKLKITAIKNLFKTNAFVSSDFLTYYLDSFVFGSVDDFMEELLDLSQINYTRGQDENDSQTPYFSIYHYNKLFEKFYKDVPDFDIYEFLTKLREVEKKSKNLQDLKIISNPAIYDKLITNLSKPYDFYKVLIQDEETKKAYYQPETENPNDNSRLGLNYFIRIISQYDEPSLLMLLSEYVQDKLFVPDELNTRLLIKVLRQITDKKLLLNFDITMPIFEKLQLNQNSSPIASCFASTRLSRFEVYSLKTNFLPSELSIFTNQNNETVSIKEKREKIKSLILHYYETGLIDLSTFQTILNIAKKYNKNITSEKLVEMIRKNKNLKDICEYISLSKSTNAPVLDNDGVETTFEYPNDIETDYQKQLYHFELLFQKTRFQTLPELEAYKKMSLDQIKNFNVKVWNQFASLPIFAHDSITKKALVEFIAIMGLFENDENAENRRKIAYQLINEIDDKITFLEIDETLLPMQLSYAMDSSVKDLEENFPLDLDFWSQFSDNPFKGTGVQLNLSRFFQPCKIKKMQLNPYAIVPQSLNNYFTGRNNCFISQQTLTRLKNTTGSTGKKINDFLSPYAKEGNVYRLKRNVVIPSLLKPFLSEEIPEEEYERLLKEGLETAKTLSHSPFQRNHASSLQVKSMMIAAFLSPISEVEVNGVKPNPKLPDSVKSEIKQGILSTDIPHRLGFENIHRMFDGLDLNFDPKFFEFFVNNYRYLLEHPEKQSGLKDLQKCYKQAVIFYKERGNANPTIEDLFDYLEKIPFVFGFGLNEFALQVKSSGVKTQERYNFYQNLLPAMEARKKTTIPRHSNTYVYVDENGKEYKVLTKILRLDDQMNMLVGESNFSDCCQVYENAGESCMRHAATSENGGILATYIIGEDGVPEMLTQSWIWTNEAKLCLDNVEATSAIKGKNSKEKRLYQDIATFGIVQAADEILKTSKKAIEEYIKTQTKRILSSKKLNEEEKQSALKQLEILKERQTLKIITVGEGCDDLNVRESFKKESEESSYGPKNYTGYRDSQKQRVIATTNEKILPIDDNYEEVPIYRDERRTVIKKGNKITHSMLKHITEIEKVAHKEQMQLYTNEDTPVLHTVEKLADIFDCELSNLHIIAGEDWYYVYSDDGQTIEVLDFAKKQPRLEDEANLQQEEMRLAFNSILAQSVVLDSQGKLKNIKTLHADMREDTSYLLYLYQKQRGILNQVGQDYVFRFENRNTESAVPFSEEEQKKLLKSARKIMQEENPNLLMHRISFVPSQKTIEKIINNALANLNERSFK